MFLEDSPAWLAVLLPLGVLLVVGVVAFVATRAGVCFCRNCF